VCWQVKEALLVCGLERGRTTQTDDETCFKRHTALGREPVNQDFGG